MQIAQIINRFSGGAVIGAWQVYDLPETLINTYIKMSVDLPKIKAGIDENRKIMAKIRDDFAKQHNLRFKS